MLPQAKPVLTGSVDRTSRRLLYGAGTLGLLLVASMTIAAPAQAWHGGAEATDVGPEVSVPGATVTIEIEPGEDPFLATDIHVPAPVVDGEQLSIDHEATNASYDHPYWSVDWNASSTDELRFRWRDAKAAGTATDEEPALAPTPPDRIEIHLNETQPITEGQAEWVVQFCNGEWLDADGTLEETVGDVPISLGLDSETGLYLCLEGHKPSIEQTFDNKAPEVEISLTNDRDQTTSPFYKAVTINVTASDDGSGLQRVAADGVRNDTGSTVLTERSEPTTWEQAVPYHVWDQVGNLADGTIPVTLVDGLAVVTAQPGPFPAGQTVTVLAGYSADASGALPEFVESATGNVSLEAVDGPNAPDIEAAGPLSDGYRRFNVTATTVGTYRFNASATDVPGEVSIDVDVEPDTLDEIQISPTDATVLTGGVVQLDASGEDRFGNDVEISPTWTTTCGRISLDGEFVAPAEAGTCTVTAEANAGTTIVSDTVDVTVQAPDDDGDDEGGDDDGSSGPGLSVGNLRSPSHAVDSWSSEDRIEVAWDAPGGEVAGYAFALTRDDGPVGTEADTSRTSITVRAGDDGAYTFKVRPIGPDGSAGEVSTLGPILVDTEGPLPPYDGEAQVTGDGLEIAWSAVPVEEGSPIAAYTVDRMPDDGSWTTLGEVADGTSYLDGVIPAPGTYHYRLRSTDEAGNSGPPSKRITVTLDEIPGVASEAGVPPSMADLYDALDLAPRDASFEDEDGDGVADRIVGDARLSIFRVTEIGGQTAYLVSADGQDTGAVVTAAGKAFPVGQTQAEIGSEKVGKNGIVVTAEAGSPSGWTLVSIPDERPDREIKGVFDGQRERVAADRVWRLDGAIAVLDDGGGTYMVLYEEGGGSSTGPRGQPATPGPGVLVAAGAFVGAAAWVARRRDP